MARGAGECARCGSYRGDTGIKNLTITSSIFVNDVILIIIRFVKKMKRTMKIIMKRIMEKIMKTLIGGFKFGGELINSLKIKILIRIQRVYVIVAKGAIISRWFITQTAAVVNWIKILMYGRNTEGPAQPAERIIKTPSSPLGGSSGSV